MRSLICVCLKKENKRPLQGRTAAWHFGCPMPSLWHEGGHKVHQWRGGISSVLLKWPSTVVFVL